jgi:LAO/AO transport system kinase
LDVDDLLARLRCGDDRALARALTLVENQDPAGREIARRAAESPRSALIVGITGPPGVGKSTLADALAKSAQAAGRKVAVLAVDPSSPLSGGAFLGDRARMDLDPSIFIRSMATRGHVGGLAGAAVEALTLLEAAGKDFIILETVGAGQDEVEVASAADATVLVLAPGLGDEIQAAKSGILEIADVFVVNKCDRTGADKLAEELRVALGFKDWSGWRPPIVCTDATSGQGVEALLDALRAHWQWLESAGLLRAKRRRALESRLRDLVQDGLSRRLWRHPEVQRRLELGLDAIEAGRGSPYALARELLQRGGEILHAGETGG